jgi:cytochrome c553
MQACASFAKWVVATIIIVVCFIQSAHAQKRFALVIGNQNYVPGVGGALKNPETDSGLVAGALNQIGFQVTSARNATRVDILREVNRLGAKLGDAGEDAIGFLYYSGHGAARPRDHVNFLIPVDVRDTSNEDFWFNTISLDDIIRELVNLAPKAAIFVVFDACRNELYLPVKSSSKGFESMRGINGVFIAFSTSPNETATDVGNAGGPYARALASELARPGLDQLALFQNVKEIVYGNTGNRQRPWESNGFVQRIYLAGNREEAPKVPPLPPNPNDQRVAQSFPAGDSLAGKAYWDRVAPRSTDCKYCHGLSGEGGFGPDLAGRGLNATQVAAAVRYPSRIMPAFIESQLSNKDAADLAAYFASLPKPAAPGKWRVEVPADAPPGQVTMITMGCGQCHGTTFNGPRANMGLYNMNFDYFSNLVYNHTTAMLQYRTEIGNNNTNLDMGNFSRARLTVEQLR